jgi:hypothetical protein
LSPSPSPSSLLLLSSSLSSSLSLSLSLSLGALHDLGAVKRSFVCVFVREHRVSSDGWLNRQSF